MSPRFFLLITLCAFAGLCRGADDLTLEHQAGQLATRFIGKLKPQLQQAMSSGGAVEAIETCARVAPQIADQLSAESGWQVKRVSLKSRNASRGQPDSWERRVLLRFDQRQSDGEAAASLQYAEYDGKRFRYMKAQGVEPLCLTCHGQDLAAPVRSVLQEYYPDDWATGYTLGQVRGAISLTKVLPH